METFRSGVKKPELPLLMQGRPLITARCCKRAADHNRLLNFFPTLVSVRVARGVRGAVCRRAPARLFAYSWIATASSLSGEGGVRTEGERGRISKQK